jgi:predicted GNAT family acetyltransferase
VAWTTTHDPEAFLALAGPFLWAAPATHSVLLTTTEALRARQQRAIGPDAPLFGAWRAPGEPVAGAFVERPGLPVLPTALPPAAIGPLAATLAAHGRSPSAVNGRADVAAAFAAAWTARTGVPAHRHRRMCLHRLDALVPPAPPPAGAGAVATEADRELLVRWWYAFAEELGDFAVEVEQAVAGRIAYGGVLVWRVDGEPVSIAGTTRAVAGMARVAPVYTPPEHRGRGYAAAATAAVTRRLLDAGTREVLLFTDLANPTTNRLYRRLGYRPVEEVVTLVFAG